MLKALLEQPIVDFNVAWEHQGNKHSGGGSRAEDDEM
jgi:hypothetical protein